MNCATCQTEIPETARYCHRCGTDERAAGGDSKRTSSYAVHPGEPVISFNLVSSLMPLASGSVPQTYRFALAVGVFIPVIAAMLGYLAFAFAAAAVVVPTAYMLYLYDVNEWEDQPVPVVIGTVVVAGVLSLVFTLLWREGLISTNLIGTRAPGGATFDTERLLILGLLVPIGAMLLSQVGPTFLASRDAFDDLIDGLTFGVAAGATFAAVETLVLNSNLFTSGLTSVDNPDAALWGSLVLSAAIVKPIIYGAAAGIAVAAFSGIGEGPGKVTPQHIRGVIESIVAVAVYLLGIEILRVMVDGTGGIVLGLIWGLIVAAALLLRVRFVLHLAVIEAALESAARGSVPKVSNQGIGFCPACAMPLMHEASFCSACGSSVRASSKTARREMAEPVEESK
jgi:hypothetical protein